MFPNHNQPQIGGGAAPNMMYPDGYVHIPYNDQIGHELLPAIGSGVQPNPIGDGSIPHHYNGSNQIGEGVQPNVIYPSDYVHIPNHDSQIGHGSAPGQFDPPHYYPHPSHSIGQGNHPQFPPMVGEGAAPTGSPPSHNGEPVLHYSSQQF